MFGTDISNVGFNPAYIPDQPSLRNIEKRVRNVPLVCVSADADVVDGLIDVVDVDSTGIEHSINPLFRTRVPQPRHGSTPPLIFFKEKLLYDIGLKPDDCCRILTTSNGVTASAVIIEPTEPDRIGASEDVSKLARQNCC